MKNQGFTLLETLLVLAIIMIISSVTIIQTYPQKDFFIQHFFLSQLQSDIYYSQQYAISHQIEVTVVFDLIQKNYYMREKYDGPLIIKRNLPSAITIKQSSLPLSFKFLSDGNVSQFGSILIYYGDQIYQLTFLLGKGRFYIVKV